MKKIYSVFIVMIVLSSYSVAQVNLDSALVASYYFCTNFADSSGHGYDASNEGSTFVNDRFGNLNYAIYFNGSSYVNLPDTIRLKPFSSSSISFWMKSSLSERFGLFEQRIGSNTPSDLNFNITFNYPLTQSIFYTLPNYNNPPFNYTSYDVFSPTVIDGNWHHFVFIKNVSDSTMSIYQDNLLLGYRPIQDIAFTVNGTLRIGKEISGNYWYTGYVDDIRFYSRPLNTDEINALFNEDTYMSIPENGEYKIYIFPNPASDKVYIQLSGDFGKITSIEIYNCIGQFQETTFNTSEIDISTLPGGLYNIVITNNNGEKLTKKIIKNNNW